MDFVVYDRSRHRVWVPAGNTGSVDVIDAATAKVTRIEGFPTKEVERNGNTRTVGPSSASVGDGVVYVAPYSGPLTSLDAATGKPLFAGPSETTVFAEPVIGRDAIYMAQQEGRILALQA